MATNLALDDKLVEEAKRIGGHRSKREAVNRALAEYVERHKRRGMLDLFGSLDWASDYDYKESRKRQ